MSTLLRRAGLLACLSAGLSLHAYAQRGGNCLGFTSSESDKVTVPLSLPASGPFALEAWVYYNGSTFAGAYNTVLEFGNDSPWFGIIPGGQLHFYPSLTGSPTLVPVRTWTHIAYSWDGTTGTVYIDGAAVGTSSSAPSRTGAGMGIGYNSGDTGWQGYIDEVMVWGTARTAAQVQSDRTNGTPAPTTGLLAYFKFEDAAGQQTVVNAANTALNGVLGSTSAVEANDPVFASNIVNSTRTPDATAAALPPSYPNPAAGPTTIPFVLRRAGHVRLSVLDLTGRELATLLDENRAAGSYAAPFRPAHLAAGVYFTQLIIDGQRLTQRLVVQ